MSSIDNQRNSNREYGEEMLFVNAAAERVYGYSLDELKEYKNRWLEVIHPQDREAYEHNLADLMKLGTIEELDRYRNRIKAL